MFFVAPFVLISTKASTPKIWVSTTLGNKMNTQYRDHRFSTYVKRHFDFLIDEYGFEYIPKSLGYVKGELELEFFHGKGEMEVVFFVRREDEIFKPFVSRSFDFIDIVRRQSQGKLEFPSGLPQYIISVEDADKYLSFYSLLAKTFCRDQLGGNLALFEKIHLKRRQGA